MRTRPEPLAPAALERRGARRVRLGIRFGIFYFYDGFEAERLHAAQHHRTVGALGLSGGLARSVTLL